MKEELLEIRRLIEQGWTTLTNARDAGGNPASCMANDAVCFCLSGAVTRSCTYDNYSRTLRALLCVLPPGYGGIVHFNDTQTTKEPVLALIDRAIAKLEAA